jgi:hypothetical protein
MHEMLRELMTLLLLAMLVGMNWSHRNRGALLPWLITLGLAVAAWRQHWQGSVPLWAPVSC